MKKLLSTLASVAIATGAATGILNGHSTTINKTNASIKATATDLTTIITVTNLGAITMAGNIPTKTELLTAIQNKNSAAANLTISDFAFHDISTETNVTIVGIGNYTGQVSLNYFKDTQPEDLNNIIPITNLGSITMSGNSPTKTELLTAIQNVNVSAANLTTSNFILFDTSTPTSVIIIGIGDYTGEVFLQYQKQLTNISTIITTTDLGAITFNGSVPTKAELLTGIQNVNTGASILTVDDFDLQDTPTQESATLVALGVYSGTVTVNYSQSDTRTDISTIITTTNLGNITTGGVAPTKSQLLAAIQAVNTGAANLTVADFGFDENPTTTGVTIYGIGQDFKGSVALTYTVS